MSQFIHSTYFGFGEAMQAVESLIDAYPEFYRENPMVCEETLSDGSSVFNIMVDHLPLIDSVFTFALENDGDIVRAIVFGDVNGIVDAGTFPSDSDAVTWVSANWPTASHVTV